MRFQFILSLIFLLNFKVLSAPFFLQYETNDEELEGLKYEVTHITFSNEDEFNSALERNKKLLKDSNLKSNDILAFKIRSQGDKDSSLRKHISKSLSKSFKDIEFKKVLLPKDSVFDQKSRTPSSIKKTPLANWVYKYRRGLFTIIRVTAISGFSYAVLSITEDLTHVDWMIAKARIVTIAAMSGSIQWFSQSFNQLLNESQIFKLKKFIARRFPKISATSLAELETLEVSGKKSPAESSTLRSFIKWGVVEEMFSASQVGLSVALKKFFNLGDGYLFNLENLFDDFAQAPGLAMLTQMPNDIYNAKAMSLKINEFGEEIGKYLKMNSKQRKNKKLLEENILSLEQRILKRKNNETASQKQLEILNIINDRKILTIKSDAYMALVSGVWGGAYAAFKANFKVTSYIIYGSLGVYGASKLYMHQVKKGFKLSSAFKKFMSKIGVCSINLGKPLRDN